ncbi:hypothetical protein NBRC116601_31590 [Cognatishimia sp. WU-CL00825]
MATLNSARSRRQPASSSRAGSLTSLQMSAPVLKDDGTSTQADRKMYAALLKAEMRDDKVAVGE